MEADLCSKLDDDGGKKTKHKMALDRDDGTAVKGVTVIKDRNGKLKATTGSTLCLGKLRHGVAEQRDETTII